MKDSSSPSFKIEVDLEGNQKELTIKPGETTDGEDFYFCELNGEEVSQVRKDVDEDWKQLWGKLAEAQVEQIGAGIDKHLEADL